MTLTIGGIRKPREPARERHPAGVYSVDGTLNPTQHKQLADWLK